MFQCRYQVDVGMGIGASIFFDPFNFLFINLQNCLLFIIDGQALKILKEGGSAGDAVLEATKVLENCGVLNAGKGSNLTIDGTVECDAAFMDGDGYFGSVGAVPGVPNPSVMCKTIADIHRKEKLFSGGRIPPK